MIKNTCTTFGVNSIPKALPAAQLLKMELIQSQETTIVSWLDAIGSDGLVAYSLVQMVQNINTGSTGTVGRNIQDTHKVFTFEVQESEVYILLLVFPILTTDNLILKKRNYNMQKWCHQIFENHAKSSKYG